MDDFDDDGDGLDERELPDPSDMDADDYTITIRCPYCKNFIDEQSEVCPRCGNFLLREDTKPGVPLWINICIVVVLVAIFLTWVL